MKSAFVGAERVEQERELEQALGVRRQRANHAQPNDPAEQPRADVQQLDLVASDKAQIAQPGIAVREELQVRNVAIAEEPSAELGIVDGVQALPSEHPFPLAVRKDRERLADITEDCRRSAEPAVCRLCRGDTVNRAFDPAEIDRKSTRLNSSHPSISYAVFCLK